MRQVLYEEGQQRASVAQVVNTWLDTAKSLTTDGAFNVKQVLPYPALWSLQEALAEHHLCFKHPGFSEEREWRLIRLVDVREALRVSWHGRNQERYRAIQRSAEEQGLAPPALMATTPAVHIDVHFRRSSIGLVPYVELPLRKWGLMSDELPIVRVVQGPTENPDLSLESLKGYLESEGYGGFDSVRTSRVPFSPDHSRGSVS